MPNMSNMFRVGNPLLASYLKISCEVIIVQCFMYTYYANFLIEINLFAAVPFVKRPSHFIYSFKTTAIFVVY